MGKTLSRFLDPEGRVAVWPARRASQLAVLRYLGNRLDFGVIYTEKEINRFLTERHTFGDYFRLRRGMVDCGILRRVPDGSRYWRGDILPDQFQWRRLTLRRVAPADRAAVVGIQRQCADYSRCAGRDFTPQDADDIIQGALPPQGHPEFFHARLICAADGEPAGYLAYYTGYPDGRCLYIASLFLAKPYRRQGIGSTVVGGLAEAAAQAGISVLRAGVMTENIPGLSFWVRQGFSGIAGVYPYENTDENTDKYVLSLFRRLTDADSGRESTQEELK